MADGKRGRRVKTTSDGSEARETYQSYLLRLWQVRERQGVTWRASLESVRTRQRTMLSGLEALFEYLRAETGVEAISDLGPRFGAN